MSNGHIDIAAYLEKSSSLYGLPDLSVGIYAVESPPLQFETKGQSTRPSIFKIGSLTKLVTALAVLKLHEDGALDLNDQVSEFIPWFPSDSNGPGDEPATVLDLLSHRSGLPRGEFFNSNPSRDEIRQSMNATRRAFNRKSENTVKYSNLGYILLGFIIESVSDSSYASYVERTILDPLEMGDSGFGNAEAMAGMTKPHRWNYFSKQNENPHHIEEMPLYEAPHSAMDMFSTLSDFSRLLTCILDNGEYDGRNIFSPHTIATLLEAKHPMDGQPHTMGFGFYSIQTVRGETLFENAEHFGHSACMRLIPSRKFATVAMTNRGSAAHELSEILNTLTRYWFNGKRPEILSHNYPGYVRVVGEFETEDGLILTVTARGEQLSGFIGEEKASPLIYKGQGCFIKGTGTCSSYTFRLDKEGDIVRGLFAGPLHFRKKPFETSPPGPREYSEVVGIYRNPKVGGVALFERNRQLILAYSPLKEAVLEEISPQNFIQNTGPFVGESVVIHREDALLTIGRLDFRKTQQRY